MSKITDTVWKLAQPVAEKNGCELWDVEYVKEVTGWNLIIYIDREDGISLTDCEMVNDAVEPIIDEADPIEGSYTFEVSSAGAERVLKRPSDFQRFLGSPVTVKLYKARDGRKEFAGHLKEYDNGTLTITVGKAEMVFGPEEVAMCRLRVEF